MAVVLTVAMAMTAWAAIPSGTQFLSGDNFEIDGNKAVDNNANIDWATPAPNVHTVSDPSKVLGGGIDCSFGQGTKENTAVPTIVTGSIPPNKSDFSEFQIAYQTQSSGSRAGHTIVYLDWTRTNTLGSADMDFELNQSSLSAGNETTDCKTGTPKRTQGDRLVTFDFANGANNVSIHDATWNGNATSGSWSALTSLDSTEAVASISDDLKFGELAIDLNAAGIFQAGTCESFSQSYLKSRSSDSFTSEEKDYVAPTPVSITNCGRIVVKKVESGTSAPLTGATFTVSHGSPPVTDGTMAETPSGSGIYCLDNLLKGTVYTITETSPPPGHDLASPSSTTVTPNNTKTCKDVIAAADVDYTFEDPPSVGAIAVHKTAKDHNATGGSAPLANATFEVLSGGSVVAGPAATNDSGDVCFGNLPISGTYTLRETDAPAGYKTADDIAGITVSKGTCDSGPAVENVTDVPLSTIEVIFTSQAGDGVTTATITCGNDPNLNGLNPDNSSTTNDKSFSNLEPGKYDCQVDIDP